MNLEQSNAAFQTTQWTLVRVLGTGDDAARRDALSQLTRAYWPVIYGYLRRRGWRQEQASETTQAFFADVVLRRDLFEVADPDKGRLRTLVLAALRRYLIDCTRADSRRPRSLPQGSAEPDGRHLDRLDREIETDRDSSPEAAFDRAWAAAAVEEANRRCERHFRGGGRAAHWMAFEARVLRPAMAAVEPPPLTAVAAELGFPTPAQVAAAVQVVKKRMLVLLREVAAETTSGEDEAEAEYRWLLQQLS